MGGCRELGCWVGRLGVGLWLGGWVDVEAAGWDGWHPVGGGWVVRWLVCWWVEVGGCVGGCVGAWVW